MQVIDVARLCHEVNRAYCIATGDDSHKPWDEAPEWQKESVTAGVVFHLANPDATPEASHNEWLALKLAIGWKYGPVKDEQKREHPCCVPFMQLPTYHKVKDHLFKAIVNTVADHVEEYPAPPVPAEPESVEEVILSETGAKHFNKPSKQR